MEEVIRNRVILQTIGECLEFEDLKNARIVNKLWNRILNIEFQKRALARVDLGELTNQDEFTQEESTVANQELLAKVYWKIGSLEDSIHTQTQLFVSLVTKSVWLPRVKRLELYRYWKAEELNPLIPFILHSLPCLQKLQLGLIDEEEDKSAMDIVIPTDVSPEEEFSISCFEADFDVHLLTTPLDPTFLRQCKRLKEFKANVGSDKAILDFLKLWKKVSVPSMRYNYISFDLLTSNVDDKRIFCEAIVDFINVNNPKRLRLQGFELMDFGLKTLDDIEYEASYQWTSAMSKLQGTSVQSLVSTFPGTFYYGNDFVHPDWALGQLKKCKAFAEVTELVFKTFACEDYWLHPTDCQTAEMKHNFDQVESLVICERYHGFHSWSPVIPYELFGSFCGKVAHHLRNLKRLAIEGMRLREDDIFDFDEIFNELNQFQTLQELTLDFFKVDGAAELIQAVRDNHNRGYFGGLSVLTGLREFRLMMPVQEVPRSYLFILFSGYEPHVALELEMYDFGILGENRKRRARLQLTVDQFREAVETVEAYWVNPLLCVV